MTDDIRRALALAYSVGRDTYASGGVAHLLPSHLGQALAIQGVGRFHNPLSARPHFDDGGDSSSGSDNSNGGIGNGGWSDGTSGFGFGGIDTSGSSSKGAPGTSATSSGGFNSGAPAGSSTGGYGGFGGYGSSASVGGSYNGNSGAGSYSSSHVSSAPSNDSSANSGAGSIGGAFGGYSSGDAFGSNNGGFGGVTGAPGTSAGFGQNGFAGGALGGFNSTNTGNGVGFTSGTNAFGGLNSGAIAGSAGPESTADASAYNSDFGSFLAKMGLDSNDLGFKTSMDNAISSLSGTAASKWAGDGTYTGYRGQDIGPTSYAAAHDVPDGPSMTVTPGVISQTAPSTTSDPALASTIASALAQGKAPTSFSDLGGMDYASAQKAALTAPQGYGTFDTKSVPSSTISDHYAGPGTGIGDIAGDTTAAQYAGSYNSPSISTASVSPTALAGLIGQAPSSIAASSATPQSLGFDYSGTGMPATIGNERALTVFGNSYNPDAASYAGPAATPAPAADPALQAKIQAALKGVDQYGDMAASTFGTTADAFKTFLNHPETPESQVLGQNIISQLDNAGFMTKAKLAAAGSNVDEAKGFVSDVLHSGLAPATAPTNTDSGWSDHLGYGSVPTGMTTGSFGTNGLAGAGLSNSTDPSEVAGVRALTVHNPSFAGTGFSTDAGAMPGNIGSMQNEFSSAEQANGLPSGYLSHIAAIESQGNPTAQNKDSGALGEFQFTGSTAKQYGLSDPTDPVASAQAAAKFAADNMSGLKSYLGRDPTGAELYAAHQQGLSGMESLSANPNAPAASVVGMSAVVQNGGTPNMTAGQFLSHVEGMYDEVGSGPTPISDNARPQLSSFANADGTISPDKAAAYEAAQKGYEASLAPDGTLSTAMSGIQSAGYDADRSAGLAAALNAANGISSALPSFVGADHIQSQSDPIASTNPAAPGLTITPSTPSSAVDASQGTYGPEDFQKVPGWVTMGLPVIGAGRSLMTLLGGQPAGVDDPSMTRATGTGSSASLDGPNTLPSTSTAGGVKAASTSSSSSGTDEATQNYLALLAQLAQGNGHGSIYVPAFQTSSSEPLVAPSAGNATFYNPLTDPVVARALQAARRS